MMNEIVNVFDFNFFAPIGHNSPITDRKGVANAFRANHFFSGNEFFPATRIQPMCSSVSRRTPDSDFLLFRSIPLHGFRSTDLSGKSSRYRDMSAGHEPQALSRRDQGQGFSKYAGRCERKTGLAHLRRLCSCVDRIAAVFRAFATQLRNPKRSWRSALITELNPSYAGVNRNSYAEVFEKESSFR